MLTFLAAASIAAAPAATTMLSPGPAPFVDPVADEALANARGTASKFALRTEADVQSRDDFRFIGGTSTMQMDIWWTTVGSELIANNVRMQFQ